MIERDTGSAGQFYSFIISTGDIDLMGDTISVTGWDLSTYRTNSVVLFGHNSDALPIGSAISTRVESGRLISTMRFASDGFAQRVKRMVDDGSLKATSVGFSQSRIHVGNDHRRCGNADARLSGPQPVQAKMLERKNQ